MTVTTVDIAADKTASEADVTMTTRQHKTDQRTIEQKRTNENITEQIKGDEQNEEKRTQYDESFSFKRLLLVTDFTTKFKRIVAVD